MTHPCLRLNSNFTFKIFLNTLAFFFAILTQSSAQIIGQSGTSQTKETDFRQLSLRSFEVGGSQARFTPLSENSGLVQYQLNRTLLSFLLRQDNSMLFFDYSRRKVDDVEVGLNSFGAKFDFEFILTNNYRRLFKPMIVISFVADLIQADAEGNASRDNPRLTSLGLGGGFGLNISNRRFIFVLKGEGYFGFGTQGFSAAAGSARGLLADAAFQVPNLIGSYGLAFSYRFRYTISDYSENQYDYLFNINTFTMGLTF